jgi:hypothetical protein
VRTVLVALALLMGGASATGAVSTRLVRLDDGAVVQLVDLGSLGLERGESALLISYVTAHPFESPALAVEAQLVWRAFLPELWRRGLAHGVVVAMSHVPSPGKIEGRMWHACFAQSGETLWLDSLGVSPSCARSSLPFGVAEPVRRVSSQP